MELGSPSFFIFYFFLTGGGSNIGLSNGGGEDGDGELRYIGICAYYYCVTLLGIVLCQNMYIDDVIFQKAK